MAIIDLKTINNVDGRKVNHPHSGANILFAILTFVFAAFPLLFLFIPNIANDPGANGIDIIKYSFDYIDASANGGELPPTTNLLLCILITILNPEYQDPGLVMYVVMTVLIFVMCVFSFALIITSIVHLAKGYLKYSVAIPVIASIDFVISIVYFILLLCFHTWVAQVPHTQPLVVWFMIIPMIVSLFFTIFFGALHAVKFGGAVLEKDIEIVAQEVPEPQPVAKPVKNVKEKKVEQNGSIPADVSSIGGHAYAENQQITVANIPLAVNKLGVGAFANCLNLKVVSLPKSVIEIGENCFFNCASLERVNYAGTKEEWSRIKRGSNWLARAKTTEVVCSDGVIVVDPYK